MTFRETVLLPNAARPPADAVRGLQVSRGDVLQHLLLQRQISHQPLQASVFPSPDPSFDQRLIQIEPAIFLAPAVVTLIRDLRFTARDRHRLTRRRRNFDLPQQRTICSGLGLFFGMTKLLSKPISINSLGTKEPGEVSSQQQRRRSRSPRLPSTPWMSFKPWPPRSRPSGPSWRGLRRCALQGDRGRRTGRSV